MKGKLIILEGVDGAGCETQSKLLASFLNARGKRTARIDYPDYKNPIGNLIYEFLHRKYNFSPEIQLLLYASDMIKDKEKILSWLKEGITVVACRYFTSTLAYQCMQGFPLEKALKFARLFEMPKPNIIFFLKISTDTAIKRKMKEKTHLDKNESNEKFLKDVSSFYNKLIKQNVFGKWNVIDGEQDIESVFEEITRSLKI